MTDTDGRTSVPPVKEIKINSNLIVDNNGNISIEVFNDSLQDEGQLDTFAMFCQLLKAQRLADELSFEVYEEDNGFRLLLE